MAYLDNNGLQRFWERLKPHVNFVADCHDIASTQSKTVDLPKFKLEEGARVTVNFVNGNTTDTTSLQIGDSARTRKLIVWPNGSPITASQASVLNGYCDFIYDGSYWVLVSSQAMISNRIVYTESAEPANAVEGMIWLKKKPVIVDDEEEPGT